MAHTTHTPLTDRELRRLAAEQPRPLFPLLRQADAMAPLVVVLAFLPPLYAVAHRTLTEAGAQQGLLSLQCLAARDLNGFIDPASSGSVTPLAFQPLLMNWLTALGLKLFGVGNAAGHVASAYLCTAAMILAVYVLARRFGGERLGLVTALLLAFNPHVLQLSQEPLPQSAAALFALLAAAGGVAHWQKSTSVASVQLLFGGIALGLCLLAGGPVAISVVLMLLLHAATWNYHGWRQARLKPGPDQLRRRRRLAIASVLVLAGTGFAAGGWRSLLMGSRYGTDFWRSWLRFGAAPADGITAPPVAAGWEDFLAQFVDLVLPATPLALLGTGVIIREVWQGVEDPGRRHRPLLLAWLLLAAATWFWMEAAYPVRAVHAEFWKIMLIVPLTITAAIGLLALIDRTVPLGVAAAAGAATIGAIAAVFRPAEAAARVGTQLRPGLFWGVVAIAIAAFVLAILARFHESWTGERRRRTLLAALALAVLAGNCAWGAIAVRRSNTGDRELDDLRVGLERIQGIERWFFVTPSLTDAPGSEPPAQLLYTLRSLWPAGEMTRTHSWESLAAYLTSRANANESGTTLVITWSPQRRVRPTVPAGLLKAAAPPFEYRGREIAAYTPGDPPE